VLSCWPIFMKRTASSRGSPSLHGLSTNLYRILGLRPGADGKKIKAAYRALVKQFHPDINTDSHAEPRTKEINRAYETLGNPEARVVYDVELKRRRAAARARNLKVLATGMAAFLLTLCLIPMVALLPLYRPTVRSQIVERTVSDASDRPEAGSGRAESGARAAADEQARTSIPPPVIGSVISSEQAPTAPRPGAPSPGDPARIESALTEAGTDDHGDVRPTPSTEAAEAPSPERASALVPEKSLAVAPAREPPAKSETEYQASPIIVGEQQARSEPAVGAAPALSATKPRTWAVYRNARAGFTLKYPADVFVLGENEVDPDDRLLTSKDGRALLRISVVPNEPRQTVAEYRRSLMAERYADATFDYTPRRDNWFVLSGSVGGEMFYQRITFSCDQRSIQGWLLVYPIAERPLFDAIVEEMHRSYRYGSDPSRSCGEPGPARTHARSTESADVTPSEQ
jgi:curved DNA-binding protein CbpA